jgi:hypothetical protein
VSEAHDLVERLDHGVLVGGVNVTGAVTLTKPEDRLNDRELSGRSVETLVDVSMRSPSPTSILTYQ